MTAFDNVEQAREYWQKESARIESLREQYRELNEQGIKRQAENDALMKEKSLLFVDSTKENTTAVDSQQEAVVFNRELPFAAQVDASLKGELSEYASLKVCDTPDILIRAGFGQLPMLYGQEHLCDALKEKSTENPKAHGLALGQVKSIPFLLQNPVILMDSNSPYDGRRGSVVAVLNAVDSENAPIVASIIPDYDKGIYNLEITPSNYITSVYGKDNNFGGWIERALQVRKVFYWDKKMSQSLFSCQGLQLPEALNELDSDIIIRKANAFVNTQTQNSSKNSEEVASNVSNVTQQTVEQPQTTVADKQPTEQVAATVADVAASKAGRPVVKLRMTEAEANVFTEFVTARNDLGMGEKQVIDMGVDRPQSRDFWIGLSYLGKVKQSASLSMFISKSYSYPEQKIS